MQNNPFKRNPTFSDKETNAFSRKNGDNKGFNNKMTTKEKEWGAKKFTPIVRPQQSTPWASYKLDIIQKQNEETRSAGNNNLESEEAKQFLKKRQETVRRMQIIESKNEKPKWECFNDDLGASNKQPHGKTLNKRKNVKKALPKTKKFGKTKIRTELVDDSLLEDFDSKKLTFHQNNKIRRIITKTTYLARGSSLESAVKHLQREGIRQKRPQH